MNDSLELSVSRKETKTKTKTKKTKKKKKKPGNLVYQCWWSGVKIILSCYVVNVSCYVGLLMRWCGVVVISSCCVMAI